MPTLEETIGRTEGLEVVVDAVGKAFQPVLVREIAPGKTERFHVARQSYATAEEARAFGENFLAQSVSKHGPAEVAVEEAVPEAPPEVEPEPVIEPVAEPEPTPDPACDATPATPDGSLDGC
jgi:hypothetical protein